MKQNMHRREFLEFMGKSAVMAGMSPLFLQACASMGQSTQLLEGKPFRALAYSDEDSLKLAGGLNFHLLCSYGDVINKKGEVFGINNDFTAFFPFSENEGLLCVNHEYPAPIFVPGYEGEKTKSRKQVEKEMSLVGVSILHIEQKSPGKWTVKKDSAYNRKVSGQTMIPFSGGERIFGSKLAMGTLGNCAGGTTPWGSYLTCEENYDDNYGEVYFDTGKRVFKDKGLYNWVNEFPLPPEHYGWVVEINPKTAAAKKLIPMGRFAHEGATLTKAKDGRNVVYMGDDKTKECIYKFISDSSDSLESGTLYVANTKSGQWIALDREKNPLLKEKFKDQTELLIRTREAAKLVGATPQDRPEDIEVCPRTGAVYVCLSNNVEAGNFHGSILKIVEKNSDPLAMEFSSSTFLAGGEKGGFSCPDNMAFDPKGNLWLTTDMSARPATKERYKNFKNNGLFFIPMSGKNAGIPFLVATGPIDSELAGPWFSPNGKTLFLSVQHPGEQTKDLNAPTSHWPDGGNSLPKSSVVAISGPLLDTIMGA